MDFTIFQYITSVPDVITNADWYALAITSYNLGLTGLWFFIGSWLIDKVFICMNKTMKKGSD